MWRSYEIMFHSLCHSIGVVFTSVNDNGYVYVCVYVHYADMFIKLNTSSYITSLWFFYILWTRYYMHIIHNRTPLSCMSCLLVSSCFMNVAFIFTSKSLCGLTISTWISNHMPSKVWGEITYPFPNLNGFTVEVWECRSNFIPHFIMSPLYSLPNLSH